MTHDWDWVASKQPSQWRKKNDQRAKKSQFCKSRTMYLLFWMNKVYNFIHHCTYCTTPFAGNQLIKSMCTTLLSRIFLLILIYFFKFYTQHTRKCLFVFEKKSMCNDWLTSFLINALHIHFSVLCKIHFWIESIYRDVVVLSAAPIYFVSCEVWIKNIFFWSRNKQP